MTLSKRNLLGAVLMFSFAAVNAAAQTANLCDGLFAGIGQPFYNTPELAWLVSPRFYDTPKLIFIVSRGVRDRVLINEVVPRLSQRTRTEVLSWTAYYYALNSPLGRTPSAIDALENSKVLVLTDLRIPQTDHEYSSLTSNLTDRAIMGKSTIVIATPAVLYGAFSDAVRRSNLLFALDKNTNEMIENPNIFEILYTSLSYHKRADVRLIP